MKPTVALFVYDPKCSVQSSNGIIQALQSNYNFKIFSRNSLEENFFDNVDMIAIPGGIGDAESFDKVFKYNGNRVKQFIHGGGRYLGICMGAYWAGSRYFDILDGVDAVQYIRRPGADIRRSYGTTAPVTWNNQAEDMYFYDGCALIGDETKFDTVARYANGDPMAIIQGRIGIIGCHPESQEYWYQQPWQYINSKWHNQRHWNLLLEFADRLVLR
jgi:glutamine amidotransferase-like uncharacterized protein